MKLLCVVPEYPPHAGGGMLRYYRTLLPELARLGHEIHVVVAAPFSPPFPTYEHDGVVVECVAHERIEAQARRFGHLGPAPHLRRYLGAAWAAWEHVAARSRFDLVELADWGLLFAPWITEETSTAVSVTLHGSAGQIDLYDAVPGAEGVLLRMLEGALLAGADALIASEGKNAEAWERITGRSVGVIPPPFRPIAATPEAERDDGRGLVVARIQHWKGPQVLCEALRRVGAAVPPIRWVGRDMPYRTHASMSGVLAERYPDIWGKRIEPLGVRTPAETSALERSAAFVVIPSLWDVFNVATVEALAFGKVVIVSSGAGVSGLVTDGVNGFVHPAGDALALAVLLERVAAMGAAERREIGNQGRLLVERELDPGRVAKARAVAYARAIEQRRTASRAGVGEWVRCAVKPDQDEGDSLSVLEHVALRDLARHVGARVLGRLRGGVAAVAAALGAARVGRGTR